MRRWVVDASVAVKWVLPGKLDEPDVEKALGILESFRNGQAELVQPLHWLAEVASVVVRLDPRVAPRAVSLLYAMEVPVAAELRVFVRACELSASLGHHLLDTLYHAVALCEPGTRLVTADERYFRAARHHGGIVRLADFATPG